MATLRSVSSAFQTALEADEAYELVTLVEIGTTPAIRRALWPQDVTFGGVTYTADGGVHSELRSDIENQRPGMTLQLQNIEDDTGATLPWSTLLATGSINGIEVTFRVVSTALLSDADAVILEAKWYISGWGLDHKQVTFKLGSPHSAAELPVPVRMLGSSACILDYQKGACTSASTLPTCAKRIEDCRKRFPIDETLRFGPSYPFITKGLRRRR